jgi:hypothetical protein
MEENQPRTAGPEPPEGEVTAKHAYLAVARRLVQLKRPICGLWPVPADMGLEAPSLQLAAALTSLGFKVGLVEPQARWGEDVSQSEPALCLSHAGDGIDVFTPAGTRGADPGTVIERTLALVRESYDRVLFDLSGLDLLGVHRSALVPGLDVVLFVATGRTHEFALARMRRRLPPERILGVVLVDRARANQLVLSE